jgi:hypothetical protein
MAQASEVGTPEKRGPGHWFVPSGKVGYHVRWVLGRYTCCCSAHRFRPHLACKHIMAVRRLRKEVPMA